MIIEEKFRCYFGVDRTVKEKWIFRMVGPETQDNDFETGQYYPIYLSFHLPSYKRESLAI